MSYSSVNANGEFFDTDLTVYSSVSADSIYMRTFEQIISERCDLHPQGYYRNVFESIRDKLFVLGEIEQSISDSDYNKFKEKHNISKITDTIDTFKKNISDLYARKIEIEIMLDKSNKEYTSFCENIKNSVKSIEIINNFTKDDELLKQLLLDKIESCYTQLNLESLKKEHLEIISEFNFLKNTLIEFSGINFSTMCGVCMDKQVSWYIDPCGHTLCNECKTKCESTINCHYCRNKKNCYKRLYL